MDKPLSLNFRVFTINLFGKFINGIRILTSFLVPCMSSEAPCGPTATVYVVSQAY